MWNSRPDISACACYYIMIVVSILVFVELAPGRVMVSPDMAFTLCFNPCFCGTRARTRVRGLVFEGTIKMFQSLFLWNSRPDAGLKEALDLMEGFQSLFLWNSRPDRNGRLRYLRRSWFQSLFLWNSRPDGIDPDIDSILWMFQSLFLWNSRPDGDSRVGGYDRG